MPDSSQLAKRLSEAGVAYVEPSSNRYAAELRKNFNQCPDFVFRPALFAQPVTVKQLSAAVKAGAELGFKVVARSGGHSASNMSLGGQHGQLVIDMAHFNDIEVNASKHEAILGAGNRLGPVYIALDKHGEAISAGYCPAIAMGGSIAHGGLRVAHRKHAMASDAVFAFDAVLADGSEVHVTEKEHPDLFWALKGTASSFAIVTRYHLSTFTPPPRNQRFVYTWKVDQAGALQLWRAFQTWSRSQDAVPAFGAVALIAIRSSEPLPPGHSLMIIRGTFLGERADFDRYVKSLLEAAPSTANETVLTDLSWIELMEAMKEGVSEEEGLACKDYAQARSSYDRSLMMADDLSDAAIQEILAYTSSFSWEGVRETDMPFIMVDLVGGTDSAYNKVPPEKSSVPRRKDATYLIWIINLHLKTYEEPDDVPQYQRDWVKTVYAICKKHLHSQDFGAYANTPNLGTDDTALRLFGENHDRLRAIKRRYDPHDVFSTPITVRP